MGWLRRRVWGLIDRFASPASLRAAKRANLARAACGLDPYEVWVTVLGMPMSRRVLLLFRYADGRTDEELSDWIAHGLMSEAARGRGPIANLPAQWWYGFGVEACDCCAGRGSNCLRCRGLGYVADPAPIPSMMDDAPAGGWAEKPEPQEASR